MLHSVFTCLRLKTETLEQGVKYLQVNFEHISACSSGSIVNFEHATAGWDINSVKKNIYLILFLSCFFVSEHK